MKVLKKDEVRLKHMEGNVLKELRSLGIHAYLVKDRAQRKEQEIYICNITVVENTF